MAKQKENQNNEVKCNCGLIDFIKTRIDGKNIWTCKSCGLTYEVFF